MILEITRYFFFEPLFGILRFLKEEIRYLYELFKKVLYPNYITEIDSKQIELKNPFFVLLVIGL